MEFRIKEQDTRSGCIAVGVFEQGRLSAQAKQLDGEGAITQAMRSGDISGKPGSTLLLRGVGGVARVLLVGLGAQGALTEGAFGAAVRAMLAAFAPLGAAQATVALPLDEVAGRGLAWAIGCVVAAARDSVFRRDGLKSRKQATSAGVKRIVLAARPDAEAKAALAGALATANGVDLCKELGNLPANICTPAYLAEAARKLGREWGTGVQVLDRKQIEQLDMRCLLAVADGSDVPPRFIILKHMGGKPRQAPVVLVGKGITFDSGGISIKPGAGMEEMKYDMCGGAAVLGAFRAIAEMGLPLNVIGLVAACENMPSGRAVKPGDIVASMSGLTVEVQNTDAEGRMVLCDALAYAERFKPAAVVDIATLTGACVSALGHHHSGLFTRHDAAHDALAGELLSAGRASGDLAWRMPLGEAYQEQIKSEYADLANLGSPGAGSITAACFLENFTRAYSWAHLDIAGSAWGGSGTKGASGRPVPLLVAFLLARARG
ncbi:aminopeptidase [Massilia sp. Root351]|uniref:leucyl aminopeptidase n=1 Tax=Massilia sp. Root351 TaxID=1736522 RepID=UPI000710D940|nr:leucyl aminopeptidase [Massilia sp. Root351]KQV90394.1 aminopeptidase [Massilia sp. Root351]